MKVIRKWLMLVTCLLCASCVREEVPLEEEAVEEAALQEMSGYAIYLELAEEIGYDRVGGCYYDAESEKDCILLTQKAISERQERESTAMELELDKAVEAGRVKIMVCNYSKQELLAFQKIINGYFSPTGIEATGIDEEENKVHIYAHEGTDLSEIYEKVPEDAIMVTLGDIEVIDL